MRLALSGTTLRAITLRLAREILAGLLIGTERTLSRLLNVRSKHSI